ncbi:MAG TPA: hypothetical protein VKD89_05645 [Candidatus Udaeobacter sp.]|nr:hypothetical protein [Candidatus Udaeobacter sp.]
MRKSTPKKIAAAACAQEKNFRIKTQTRRAEEAKGEDSNLRKIRHPNTSGEATCDELVCEQTIHAMKKAIILGCAFSVIGLGLISCSSSPETSTTTTRQTTVTTALPPPTQTTTTTTHMGGGY